MRPRKKWMGRRGVLKTQLRHHAKYKKATILIDRSFKFLGGGGGDSISL